MTDRIVIVGNGISGVTAARFIRKSSDTTITIVSSESPYFFARTALMYAYMGSISDRDLKPYEDDFWSRNRLDLVQDYAIKVDTTTKVVRMASGDSLSYDSLILATGSKPVRIGWKGEELPGVQSLYSMQDLALMRRSTNGVKRAAVVGGGLTGVEVAEMLTSRGIEVVFLVRENRYMDYVLPKEESELIENQIRKHGVDLRMNEGLSHMEAGADGTVEAVVVEGGKRIEVGFVALTTGVCPRTDLAISSGINVGRGIHVNRYLETSEPDVYAVGDCAEFSEPLPSGETIQQLWYSGREQGRVVAQSILGERTRYEPDVFYNSAKFFEIEYQTYGMVRPTPDEGTHSVVVVDYEKEKLIRIDYDTGSGSVLGFNLMGIRYRQDVCSHWIRTGARIESVLKELESANFDPEFSESFEQVLRHEYANCAQSSAVA
ncbi:MAG: FAD-dependent oxidoreductase [Rhodothermia bacterium]|nr:MAG: FAD-dependent oxidoreductase [Rhodothermia bacterium]